MTQGRAVMIPLDEVVHEIGPALMRGDGAYFIGSGISVPSGLLDWNGLIRKLAKPLGIDVTEQDELPRIAQYCVNADSGNRGPLVGRLKGELGKPAKRANPYHAAISRTNITTLWTTNFDTLLEHRARAFALWQPRERRGSDERHPGFRHRAAEVHGCIDRSTAHSWSSPKRITRTSTPGGLHWLSDFHDPIQ